tara:strand:- start:46 stop:171 length:126 start_codon:yes stop_codon:yes gene_type:complete
VSQEKHVQEKKKKKKRENKSIYLGLTVMDLSSLFNQKLFKL